MLSISKSAMNHRHHHIVLFVLFSQCIFIIMWNSITFDEIMFAKRLYGFVRPKYQKYCFYYWNSHWARMCFTAACISTVVGQNTIRRSILVSHVVWWSHSFPIANFLYHKFSLICDKCVTMWQFNATFKTKFDVLNVHRLRTLVSERTNGLLKCIIWNWTLYGSFFFCIKIL